jgi:NAD(P)H-hydrate epimerase
LLLNSIRMKIVTAAEMQQLEAEAEKLGVLSSQLMENAGRAVAESARCILGEVSGRKILVLVGPGNNGGDGLVAARYLREWGGEVIVYICSSRPADDANPNLALERVITIVGAGADAGQAQLVALLSSADTVIDAIFGTGWSRAVEGVFQKVLLRLAEAKNARPALKIVAVDLPSGLNADSGVSDPAAPFADYTVTLGWPKRGLYSPVGAERSGEVIIADIGIPERLAANLKSETITPGWARAALPYRSPYSHKGSFGKVLVVAGSLNYIGAAHWACVSAARAGAGLVTLAIPKAIQALVAPALPEATYLPLAEAATGVVYPGSYKTVLEAAQGYNVILVGCGLGQKTVTREFALKTIFRLPETQNVVLDADALNYLTEVKEWWKRIPFDMVLTPHPGEMARLCSMTPEDVQANRFELAQQKAAEWNKTVVLKGANTLIAAPDGRLRINTSANAGLATAGTGDVLAGVIAGLLAQGLNIFDGAALGVYLHSQAGERVKQRIGDAGMIASDLLPELPLVIKEIKEKFQAPNTK